MLGIDGASPQNNALIQQANQLGASLMARRREMVPECPPNLASWIRSTPSDRIALSPTHAERSGDKKLASFIQANIEFAQHWGEKANDFFAATSESRYRFPTGTMYSLFSPFAGGVTKDIPDLARHRDKLILEQMPPKSFYDGDFNILDSIAPQLKQFVDKVELKNLTEIRVGLIDLVFSAYGLPVPTVKILPSLGEKKDVGNERLGRLHRPSYALYLKEAPQDTSEKGLRSALFSTLHESRHGIITACSAIFAAKNKSWAVFLTPEELADSKPPPHIMAVLPNFILDHVLLNYRVPPEALKAKPDEYAAEYMRLKEGSINEMDANTFAHQVLQRAR